MRSPLFVQCALRCLQWLLPLATIALPLPSTATQPEPSSEDQEAVLEVGEPVPEIAGEDAFGERFKLSDYRGRVVVLDFWGHW